MLDRSLLHRHLTLAAVLTMASFVHAQPASQRPDAAVKVDVRLDRPIKAISPDLFGIFFEDLNYAADGGLYAELIQNRSFEYSPADNPAWSSLSSWDIVERGGGRVGTPIDIAMPVHPNNPKYVVLEVGETGTGAGIANSGFDGINVVAGETYNLSMMASLRYRERRWGGPRDLNVPFNLTARLEKPDGTVLAETPLSVSGTPWKQYSAKLKATASEPNARFVLLVNQRGGLALDDISLFPEKTFKNRPNGLRADLAQTIADLKPSFVRFPGGCLAHGNGLPNMYRWKDTIGPIQERRGQPNIWRYHQSVGLGYFEYFQFCEDIGAKPLPVVPAGVSCQNSAFMAGVGQQAIPMDQMPAYVQEVLDLIEYANGPVTSTWGAKRAEAGHPEPFNLKYLGVGNEDAITPAFNERFKMIYDAIKAKHPEITVIGTVGPSPAGRDFDEGWKTANELMVPMVDEHYYENPDWFTQNLTRYDGYDRSKSKVYLGEFASRGNTLRNALAEAAYMTALERNGDVVHLASYAPLLAKIGHTQWNPDLIYFNNASVFPTVNYYVQKLFGTHRGDGYAETAIAAIPALEKGEAVTASTTVDSRTGDVFLKLVNVSKQPMRSDVKVAGERKFEADAECVVLAGDAKAVNAADRPPTVLPKTTSLKVSPTFAVDLPAYSLTVIRLKTAK